MLPARLVTGLALRRGRDSVPTAVGRRAVSLHGARAARVAGGAGCGVAPAAAAADGSGAATVSVARALRTSTYDHVPRSYHTYRHASPGAASGLAPGFDGARVTRAPCSAAARGLRSRTCERQVHTHARCTGPRRWHRDRGLAWGVPIVTAAAAAAGTAAAVCAAAAVAGLAADDQGGEASSTCLSVDARASTQRESRCGSEGVSPVLASSIGQHQLSDQVPLEAHDTASVERLRELELKAEHGHAEVFTALASSSRDGDPFMTFRDFLRSRLYHQYNFHGDLKYRGVSPSESRVGDHLGRISYPEFVFLTTVLAVPMEHAAVAFLMCDLDQNGVVDRTELGEAIDILSRSTDAAANMNIADVDACVQERLCRHLFGPAGDQAVDFPTFVNFVHELKADVLRAEFFQYSDGRDLMTYREFGRYLVAHSEPNHIASRLARLRHIPHVEGTGFQVEEFMHFCFAVVENAGAIASVMGSMKQQEGLTPAEFARVVRIVSGLELRKQLIDTLFIVFDANGDGRLDLSELLGVLNRRSLQLTGKVASRRSRWARFKTCLADLEGLA